MTPFESTIVDSRSAVVEKMNLLLRLVGGQVTVGWVTDIPPCQVTVVDDGENKGFFAEI